MKDTRARNNKVDIIRGIAILMVVLGHTISSSTVNYNDNWVYNIIWALQMPLFFLLSGYITRYNKPLNDFGELLKFIVKKFCCYMVPWFVWTFLVRAILVGETSFFDLKYLLYNMDAGYWFLFSLFVIVVIFGVSQFLSHILTENKTTAMILLIISFMFGAAIMLAIGLVVGINFLCIKLTLYYMPFFLAGWFFGYYQDDIFKFKQGNLFVDILISISLAIYTFLMLKFTVYELEDNPIDIAIRFIISLLGSIALCGLLGNVKENNKVSKSLIFFGN